MNLNQATLINFEQERRNNNFIPPEGSNSFYKIGDGEINLLTKCASPEYLAFELSINDGHVYTGAGNFAVCKSPYILDYAIYHKLTVTSDTTLSVNQQLSLSGSETVVHGTLELMQHSTLKVSDRANVIFYPDSTLDIKKDSNILVEGNCTVTIYGCINIDLALVNTLLNNEHIKIDTAAVMNVTGLDALKGRMYSLTDYEADLRKKVINVDTQGVYNIGESRIGYLWAGGDPRNHSQHIIMQTLYGDAVLGDFKLSVLGIPERDIPDLQIITQLHVMAKSTLYITECYKDLYLHPDLCSDIRYIHPELYLGIIIDNNYDPAKCVVNGTIIVDGENARITIDRGSLLMINDGGTVELRNGAKIISTYNDGVSMYIGGTLIIDNIEQLSMFRKENIEFGKNGKVIILNPDTGERKLLWSTPNGIKDSELYRIFGEHLDQVEYHISKNNGIAIDEYYDFYARDMTNWYNGMRIEKAVHEGLIVWHDGAFIELDSKIIPWVNNDCTLLEASRIFKSYGENDRVRLQDTVRRLQYAGFNNILFRFIDGDDTSELTLRLVPCKMKNAYHEPMTEMYSLTTDNDGELFIRNKVSNTTEDEIINEKSRSMTIKEDNIEFSLM